MSVRRSSAGALAAAVAGLATLLLASPAAAASKIGLADAGSFVVCPAGSTYVQMGSGAPTPSYAVPAGGGVVTAWEVEVSAPSGASMALKLFRPSATANTFTVVGQSGFEPVATGLQTFATRVPVQPGDMLGFTTGSTSISGCLRPTPSPADLRGGSPNTDPAFGAAFTPATLISQQALSVAAVVEADADADGFGDETQDACPASTGTANGCDVLAPETTIEKPKKKLETHRKKALAKFRFSSNEPGATFRCQIDRGPEVDCVSPYRRRVLRGKHTFEVRAIDAAGNPDPAPAIVAFRVVRKR